MRLEKYSTFILIAVMAVLVVYAGCGYNFRADGKPIGVEIKSLAIPLMTSSSSYKGFEADFTRIIREEFISHSKIPIVTREQAGAVLTGRIYEITTRPLTYDIQRQTVGGRTITHETTSSRRLKIRLDIRLTDRITGKLIWNDGSMEEEARFDVGTDPLINRYNQQQALRSIARLLAKRVYLKTMERF
ncbi:LPS assembly lipoprotein LptE [Thermodesulfobacteriota bacterium]